MSTAVFTTPENMTAAEVIVYLRLDDDQRNAAYRLQNLERRHGLPSTGAGR